MSIQEKGYRKNSWLEITTYGSPQCNTRLIFYSLICIAIAILLLSPVQAAGTKYMAGSPELSAYISGTNEVGPGDAVQLNVVIQNKGVNQFEFIQSSIISPNDLPNTAKFLTGKCPGYHQIRPANAWGPEGQQHHDVCNQYEG